MNLDDINTIECDDESTQEEYFMSIQRCINSGMWGMQGSYGRAMMDAIKSGYCMLGRSDATDYWGNHIPSRTQVKPGSTGSFEFVVASMGQDWADLMAEA
jgi:hypothetical protein